MKSIKAYRQFIKLKYQFEDWHCDANKGILPSVPVRKVWNQHLLDIEHYIKACHEYCGNGRIFGNNPDEEHQLSLESSREDRDERIKITRVSLQALCRRDVDADVCDENRRRGECAVGGPLHDTNQTHANGRRW